MFEHVLACSIVSTRQPVSRREQVVAALAQQITSGQLLPGERLDGEFQLAERYAVSRGTIRRALADLQQRNLIATHAGIGSVVTFDGAPLNPELGWARALAGAGAAISTELLSVERVERDEVPGLPPELELSGGIAVRRLRRTADGVAVSFECATVPAVGSLADLPTEGLADGSLTTSLRAAGLVATHGFQDVSVARLPEREARLLERTPGSPFLKSVRTSFAADDSLVEHVVSHLDPEHFRVHFTFGSGGGER